MYDGSDPAYFKNWHAKVLSHYATWLNGEDRTGHWKQHLVSDGCFIDMPAYAPVRVQSSLNWGKCVTPNLSLD